MFRVTRGATVAFVCLFVWMAGVGVIARAQSGEDPAIASATALASDHGPSVGAAAGAKATVPSVVRFSGVLQDGAGSALTGVQGVTFALYEEQTGGAPLWLETQNVTFSSDGAADGRYSVLLGSQRADGLPLDLFTSNEARWLGVRANLPDAVEQARVLLVSVPYALKAADAETLGGQPLSAFVLAPGSDGNGAVASDGPPQASASDELPAAAVTSGRIARFTGPLPSDLGDSIITENGTNIGINEVSPQVGLHVTATIAGASNFRLENTAPAIGVGVLELMGDNGGTYDVRDRFNELKSRIYTNLSAGQWQFESRAPGAFATFNMTALNTSAPVERLRLTADGTLILNSSVAGIANFRLENTAPTIGIGVMQLMGDNGGTYDVRDRLDVLKARIQAEIGSGEYSFQNRMAGGPMTWYTNGGPMTWYTNSGSPAERMRLTADGSLGVGTAAPLAGIDVVSAGSLIGRLRNAGTGADHTARLDIQNGGGVLWRHAVGGTGNSFGLTTGQYYLEQVGSGVRLLVDTSGRVGIGTNAPASALHVNGTVTATAFAGGSGGVKLASGGAKPTCDGTVRGTIWATLDGVGAVNDKIEVCVWWDGAFTWRNIGGIE